MALEREVPVPGRKRRKSGGYNMPHLGPDENPANAKWCERHGKLECVAMRSPGSSWKNEAERPAPGTPCHGPAVRGTDRCAKHSGKSMQKHMIDGEATITAWMALGKPAAGTQHIDAGMAVLNMLQMTWLRTAAYGNLLRQQVEKEGGDLDVAGLIGEKRGAAGQEGFLYAQSEEIRALVQLEATERDRVVKYAETAHKMGISDRLTSLAERWGDVVAGRISAMLLDLKLTPEQEALAAVAIVKHLSSIDMLSIES